MLATQLNIPDWLLPGLILLFIGAVLTVVVRTVFKSFRASISEWFEEIISEIKPNGGNTNKLGDLVLQHSTTLQRVEEGVGGLYPRIEAIETEQARVRELVENTAQTQ